MIYKYHVHIYKVTAKAEVDTLAYNGTKARKMAITAAKDNLLDFIELFLTSPKR